uniref:Uncharacterized protein n=1 Tax=Triticum urartu TaxID=4572 RepID=A0A8R7UGY1_TRIUA
MSLLASSNRSPCYPESSCHLFSLNFSSLGGGLGLRMSACMRLMQSLRVRILTYLVDTGNTATVSARQKAPAVLLNLV